MSLCELANGLPLWSLLCFLAVAWVPWPEVKLCGILLPPQSSALDHGCDMSSCLSFYLGFSSVMECTWELWAEYTLSSSKLHYVSVLSKQEKAKNTLLESLLPHASMPPLLSHLTLWIYLKFASPCLTYSLCSFCCWHRVAIGCPSISSAWKNA